MPSTRLTSVDQLIPEPDAFGIAGKIRDSHEESDHVNAILADLPAGCVSVVMEGKDCVLSTTAMSCIPSPQNGDSHVIRNVLLPFVRIKLYEDQLHSGRIISVDREDSLVRFLTSIDFRETDGPTTSADDRIEARYFSLTSSQDVTIQG